MKKTLIILSTLLVFLYSCKDKENILELDIPKTDPESKIADLGLIVSDAGIRDVILPGDMKEIMNQVLVAEKKAQANSIMRREETASMRSMLNTAKLMEENETLWKLKEMEYVEKIADKIGSISVAGNGQIIGSSEMYESTSARDNGIASVKINDPDATTDDQTA